MQEILDKVVLTIWGIWRFKWTALLLAWLIATGGWLFVSQMEHRYRAQARIFVDTNSVLEPLLSGIAVQPDVRQRVDLMSQALLTRPNLEKLMRMTDMDLDVATGQQYDDLLQQLHSRISMWGGQHANSIYHIAYEDEDPILSKDVVQSLITIFIESNLGEERQDSSSAQAFLEKQISEYEIRLIDSEARLSNFKRDNVGSMPNQAGGYYQRLQQAKTLQRSTDLALREARNKREELARLMKSESPTLFASSDNPGPDELRLKSLYQQLDDILVRFTDRHPDVAQLRDSIAVLENKLRDPQRSQSRESLGQPNAYYQELKGMLAEARGQVAELEVRSQDYDAQIAELNSTVDSIPQVEARLQQLDRDYETVRAQHETLLQKLESAKLSESLEQNVDDVKFRIIDPPYVPSRPSSPNKKALYLAVFGLAIGSGIALAFLLSFIRPVFHTQKSLHQQTKLPVLGSITLVPTSARTIKHGMSMVVYSSMLATLFSIFAVIMIMQIKEIDIGQLASIVGLESIDKFPGSELLDSVANSEVFSRLTQLVRKL